jgi:hypothetical protein
MLVVVGTTRCRMARLHVESRIHCVICGGCRFTATASNFIKSRSELAAGQRYPARRPWRTANIHPGADGRAQSIGNSTAPVRSATDQRPKRGVVDRVVVDGSGRVKARETTWFSIYCGDCTLLTSAIDRFPKMECGASITPCCGSSGVTIVAPGAS